MEVVFEIHGDLPDRGNRVSALVDAPLTLRKLEALLPFEGSFLFRLKVPDSENGHCWLDLDVVDRDKDIDISMLGIWDKRSNRKNEVIDVRAVALDAPGPEEDMEDDSMDMEYIQQMQRCVPAERQFASAAVAPSRRDTSSFSSPFPSSSSSSASASSLGDALKTLATSAKGLNLSTVKSGANSLWKKVKATATQMQELQESNATDATTAKIADEALASLSAQLSSPFVEDNTMHALLLQRLWTAYFPDMRYERVSAQWRAAGWQTDDPSKDLKTSGVLALACMVYFAETPLFAGRALGAMQAHQANKKSNYPFAIVGVNLTLLLADLLKLRSTLISRNESFGALFAESQAFMQVFGICFLHVDAVWTERKAVRADFSKIISELKGMLSTVLDRGPKSLEDFKYIAAAEGLTVVL
jgi:hypothetical protein